MDKIVCIIPARLNSTRFPNKLLQKIENIEIVEHVRRRAKLITNLSEVYIATPDQEIANRINSYGGKCIMTSSNHSNGTSRVIEAAKTIDFDYLLIIQGDEPLIIPQEIDKNITHILRSKESYKVWNFISKVNDKDDKLNQSIVKCEVDSNDNIIDCKRLYNEFVSKNIYELLGIFIFSSKFIQNYSDLKYSQRQNDESIEQLLLLDNNITIKALKHDNFLKSINLEIDLEIVKKILKTNQIQKKVLNKIINE